MKKLLFLIIIHYLIFIINCSATGIKAYLSYVKFYTPTVGPYLETYISIASNTCHFIKMEDGKFHANITATYIFKKDTVIKNFKKVNLASPVVDDSISLVNNFLDIQRFTLPAGKYVMELTLVDNNSVSGAVRTKQNILIAFPEKNLNISDIQLVESYIPTENQNLLSKSGFDIVPHVLGFYARNQNKLTFYSEIYNADKIFGADKKFFVKYYIESQNTKQPEADLVLMSKLSAQPINVLLKEIDITNLPSGNYNLVIEARDNENKLINSQNLSFQRSKPDLMPKPVDIANIDIENTFAAKFTDPKQLNEYLDCLYPVSTNQESQFAQTLIKTTDIKSKQQFIYNFWLNRDKVDPEKAWLNYLSEVNKADKLYNCRIKKGYQTERGRVFLTYGPPNTVYSNEHEPDAYPYEIWHYYSIKNQSNRKFVFYLRDLVTNCYELLHSDAEGEISNPQWQVVLYGRNTFPGDPDLSKPVKQWGSEVDDFFTAPR